MRRNNGGERREMQEGGEGRGEEKNAVIAGLFTMCQTLC